MKISREWLQTYFKEPLPSAADIAEALTFHAFEIDGVEEVNGDHILDVKVTPNRGHDCLSYRGIAKEVAAICGLPLINDSFNNDGHRRSIMEHVSNAIAVTIENPDLCPRYVAGYIKNVKVGPSPEWLVQRLKAMGQQSINNVVDATNYVMFNTGQPLHAFDAGKLAQNDGTYSITVRTAKEGETLIALDAKEYTLKDSMLVIVDENANKPVGIAGIKGGMPAGISEETHDIIIESANFNGVSVRKTAQALKLRTDASQRFEQGISPELASYGMATVGKLIEELAGGELVGFLDTYPRPQTSASVSVSLEKINRALGTQLTMEHATDALTRLGLAPINQGDTFTVTPPFERLDLLIPEDLIEEIGRIVGYDKVIARELSDFGKAPEINQNFANTERIREDLIAKGFSEVYTSVFADTGERAVLNKVDSVRPFLRANLSDELMAAVKKNVPNKDLLGLKEVKLFEIGAVWKEGKEVMLVGTISEKQKPEQKPLTESVTEVNAYGDLPTSTTERYKIFSRYPSITRDIALWVPASTSSDVVRTAIASSAGDLMVRLDLFDEFKKGEQTSYAFRLVFQSFEKTLTDDEANTAMKSVYDAVAAKGWTVR